MKTPNLKLFVIKESYSICRLEPGQAIPDWAVEGEFCSIARTPEELSIICPESKMPPGIESERSWRCLKIAGPLDFSLIGILAAVLEPLAAAEIPIMAVSTYETDYILVKQEKLQAATATLEQKGFLVIRD